MGSIGTTDYGITISQKNVPVKGAKLDQVNFTTKYPIAKLDRTNIASFEDITFTFNHEPPAPLLGQETATLVYTVKHNYKYIPSFWVIGTILAGQPSLVGAYFNNEYMLLGTLTFASQTSAAFIADSTNIYFYVIKTDANGDGDATIINTVIQLRLYIFVEDLLGT